MRRWWSVRRWFHLLRRVIPLLLSSRIPLREKLLFAIPALAYWVLPDAIPFCPVDDLLVAGLLAGWFADRMERKYKGEW